MKQDLKLAIEHMCVFKIKENINIKINILAIFYCNIFRLDMNHQNCTTKYSSLNDIYPESLSSLSFHCTLFSLLKSQSNMKQ